MEKREGDVVMERGAERVRLTGKTDRDRQEQERALRKKGFERAKDQTARTTREARRLKD